MCLFCSIAKHEIEVNIAFENENIIAFLDIAPINEGHVLVVPKMHFLDADEIPNELLDEIMHLSKKIVCSIKKIYNPDGYSIMQNGGKFNDIGHYHMHIFPRYDNDGFGWTESGKEQKTGADIADKIKRNLLY
ncbi:MAG: HIT family protein [Eubacteriales bacterium]|nr:HIT family protein [Eubacteriales bacterium]